MAQYLTWDTKTISDFSDTNINSLYNQGYLFTREGKGAMYQTRSLRVNLSQFKLSSENRRVLRKTENITLTLEPLPYTQYNWRIGKLGKDFYDTKFGGGIFSANKIKELLTGTEKNNFNELFIYSVGSEKIGYAICLETNELLHYCYPFYQLLPPGGASSGQSLRTASGRSPTPYSLLPNIGLGMMLRAIVWSIEHGKKYVYLGSFQRPTDTYKLQFEGIEWWNVEVWRNDLEELKSTLASL